MKKIVSAPKPISGFFEFAKMSFFSCISITRWIYYGRTIDKFNNSCAIAIFAVNQNIIKMAPYSKTLVYYACHIF